MNEIVKTELLELLAQIRQRITAARTAAVRNINTLQVLTNFEIGRLIVEHEQSGKERAKYGKETLRELSLRLTQEFGKGFSRSNLEYMRKFFLTYKDRNPEISQMASGILIKAQKSQMKTGKSDVSTLVQEPLAERRQQFSLSWSQYVFLIAISNTKERAFYEIEAAKNGWTLPELRRQFDSSLYERLALSRNKDKIRELSEKGQILEKPEDMIKNPLVLEFLGIPEKTEYSENDLENAIIDKIEHFLLELGKGFLFEARQRRFTFDEDHFFVDLVFYNRLLRCYVLIDLKIGKLTHQDLGQMQMYVNYFDRHVKTNEEHPTIGIILCKKKRSALVEITMPKEAIIYASEYQLYLPSKEELKQKLIEWTEGTGE